jgi:hypothetical protein
MQCRGRNPYQYSESLADDLNWATAATKAAVSWMHVDDDGLATAITVRTGAKYWVVAKPRHSEYTGLDLDFGVKWKTHRPPSYDEYEMEAVLLRPDSVL